MYQLLRHALVVLRPREAIPQIYKKHLGKPGYSNFHVILNSPNGFIAFLSNCYGGRASDKYITKDSGFYDLLERGDQEMADRGFQIKQLLLHFCRLEVPPGARMKIQMTSAKVKRR